MGDEVASLLAIFNSFKKSGKSATLILSTRGGEVTAKLEVKLSNAKSSSSSSIKPSPTTLLTPPGCQASRDRQRPQQSAARRTKANARAAQYRLHQALPFPGGDYTAAVGPAPPRRPLHYHLSTNKGESPPGLDGEKEGWLPAYFLSVGWRRRSTTFSTITTYAIFTTLATSATTCLPILVHKS